MGPDDFPDWLRQGMEAGFVGPPVCSTHDGIPTTLEEDEMQDFGDDICVHVLRLYEDRETMAQVEDNHFMTKERKREFVG